MTTISGLDLIREIVETGTVLFLEQHLTTNTSWIDHHKTSIKPQTLNLLHGNYALPAVVQIAANAYVKSEMSLGFVVNDAAHAKDWMLSIADYIAPGFIDNGYVDFETFNNCKDISTFISNQAEKPFLFEIISKGKSLSETIGALDEKCDLIFYPYNFVDKTEFLSIKLNHATVIFYDRGFHDQSKIMTAITNNICVYTDVAAKRNLLVAKIIKNYDGKEFTSSFVLNDEPETNINTIAFPAYEPRIKSKETNDNENSENDSEGYSSDLLETEEIIMIKMSMMVKLCRTLLKMSQTEFATFMDLSLPTVNRIENLEADLSVTELFSVMHNLKNFGININLETIGDAESDISFTIGGFAVQSYAKGTKIYDNAVLRAVKKGRRYELRTNPQRMSIYPRCERNVFKTDDRDIVLLDEESLEHLVEELNIDKELFQRLDITHKPYVASIGMKTLNNSNLCTNPLSLIEYSTIYFLPDDEFEELSLAIEGQFENLEDLDEETVNVIKMDNGDILRAGFDVDYARTLISFVHDMSEDNALTPQDFIDTRKRLKLSIKKFADLLGVSHITAARYESGDSKPSAAVVAKMNDLSQDKQ